MVIPTTFTRPEYLSTAISSILSQQGDFEVSVIIGCPAEKVVAVKRAYGADAEVVPESPEGGLAHKLDALLKATPESAKYITWLGDDDLLLPGSLASTVSAMETDTSCSLAFGGCDYIDAEGAVLATNKSGQWASTILRLGPQLIPQPGSLFRRTEYLETGGLDDTFGLAFDFDLFLKLRGLGHLKHVETTVAQFRWHPNSLSVRKRLRSALEASRVRRKHYRGLSRLLWPLWEPLVVLATWAAGKLLNVQISLSRSAGLTG